MKANKALKRLAKVELFLTDVIKRYTPSAPTVRGILEDAKAAIGRAKEAVMNAKPPVPATPDRKLGRRKGAKKAALAGTNGAAPKTKPRKKRKAGRKAAPAAVKVGQAPALGT